MKKIALFLFFLASMPVFAITGMYKAGGSLEFFFNNHDVSVGSPISTTFFNATDYSSLDLNIGAVSSGVLSTANVIWKSPNGSIIGTEVLKAGVPIRRMLSNSVTIQILGKESPVTVTGNILISQKEFSTKKRIKSYLKFNVANGGTTIVVDQSMQGYWFIRTDQKIYVNWAGTTATNTDFVLNISDALDTGVYFMVGDTIKFLADSVTAKVTGYTYE